MYQNTKTHAFSHSSFRAIITEVEDYSLFCGLLILAFSKNAQTKDSRNGNGLFLVFSVESINKKLEGAEKVCVGRLKSKGPMTNVPNFPIGKK